jgi:CPA1 family monovalent cation:H+ antiporter
LSLNGIHPGQAFLLSLPILLAVILIRPIWVFATSAFGALFDRISRDRLRRLSKTLYSKVSNPDMRKQMRMKIIKKHDVLKNYKVSDTSIQDRAILSWCGMRGVVSLAIAASVPTAVNDQNGTLITSFILMAGLVVAVVTLVVQATTLPYVITKLAVEDEKHTDWVRKEREKARQLLDDSAEKVLEDLDPDDMPISVEELRSNWEHFRRPLDLDTTLKYEYTMGIISDIIETQRQDIVDATNSGEIDPDVAKEVLAKLDHRQEAFSH